MAFVHYQKFGKVGSEGEGGGGEAVRGGVCGAGAGKFQFVPSDSSGCGSGCCSNYLAGTFEKAVILLEKGRTPKLLSQPGRPAGPQTMT